MISKFLAKELTHFVHGGLVVAGRFNLNHALEQGEHFGLVLLAELQVPGDGLGGGVGHAITMINVRLQSSGCRGRWRLCSTLHFLATPRRDFAKY